VKYVQTGDSIARSVFPSNTVEQGRHG